MMETYAWFMLFFFVLDMCCCIWLFQSFAGKRVFQHRWTAAAYFLAWLSAEWAVSEVLYDNLAVKAIAVMAVISLFIWRLFVIPYKNALVLSVLFYSVMLVADYIALVVVGTVFPGRMWDLSNIFIIYGLRAVSVAFAFGMVYCLKRMLGNKTTDLFSVREWCALAAVSLITIFAVILVTIETDWMKYTTGLPIAVDFFHIYVIGGILGVNFIGFYLIHSITERELKLREYAVFQEKVRNETAMYHSISENLEKQRKRTHEYKNQLAAISALAAEGAYQEMRAYIEQIETTLQHRMDAVDTNHVIVNAILNTKYREAVSKGIVFVLKVNDLSTLKIKDEDIVVILSNLLNNALEACERCEAKQIKLKFVLENGQAVISVKNSMAAEPLVENGKMLTSKTKDADEHGMGIRNVAETVEKYGGRYMVDYGKGEFQFSILIPNN